MYPGQAIATSATKNQFNLFVFVLFIIIVTSGIKVHLFNCLALSLGGEHTRTIIMTKGCYLIEKLQYFSTFWHNHVIERCLYSGWNAIIVKSFYSLGTYIDLCTEQTANNIIYIATGNEN